jgi:hypothetical protein
MGVFEQFPYTNLHDLNLDWVLQTMREYVATIESLKTTVDAIPGIYEKSVDITIKRKLSPTGNFTGTLNGVAINLILAMIDSNADALRYLSSQFADGTYSFTILA